MARDPKQDKKFPKEDKDSKRPFRGHGNRGNNAKRKSNKSDERFDRSNKGSRADSGSFNDLSWYAHNPELLASAAMLAFPNKPGMDVRMPHVTLDANNNPPLHNTFKLPGIMQLKFHYTVGTSMDVTSPASIAAKELFGLIRSKFSSSLGYDAPDLFMYMIALDQIHAYISYLKRVYRTINTYSSQNFYMPETMLEAVLGFTANSIRESFDYNKFVAGKVKLWNYINTLVNMANKFTFPDQFDIFRRHKWMNEFVYSDAPTIMGQFYVFTPEDFFVVDDTGSTGTALIPSSKWPTVATGMTLYEAYMSDDPIESLFEYGRRMVDALSNWEDAYTINGHFLRAFEGSNNFNSALLLQDEALDIQYVPEVLQQIHNVNVVDYFEQSSIMQDPTSNAIIYNPTVQDVDQSYTLIDLDALTPSPAEVTIATRLTAMVVPETSSSTRKLVCGSEVVTALWITLFDNPIPIGYNNHWVRVNQSLIFDYSEYKDDYSGTMENHVWDALSMSAITRWFKAPLCYRTYTHQPSIDQVQNWLYSLTVPYGEITNVTSVDAEFLSTLHRVCLYSEFNCFGKLGK